MVARCSVLDGPGLGLTKCAEALQCHDWNYFSTLHIHTHIPRDSHTHCENRQQRRKNMKCTLQLENNFARDYDKGSGLVGELGVCCWDIWEGDEESGWIGGPSKTAWAEQLIKRQRGAFSYLLHNILLFITSRRLGHATSCTIFLNPELLFQLDCQSCWANEMLLGG